MRYSINSGSDWYSSFDDGEDCIESGGLSPSKSNSRSITMRARSLRRKHAKPTSAAADVPMSPHPYLNTDWRLVARRNSRAKPDSR
eukprot:395063-Rhodomonas_salina.1